MKRLSSADRVQVLSCLVEGCSIRSTVRMTGVSKNTVIKFMRDMGEVCAAYHDLYVRGLGCQRVQVDEIWSFVGCKQKQKDRGKNGEGDVWTWTAIDADTKLAVAYLVGLRDSGYAHEFIHDIADRLANRIQLTSDGLKLYVEAVEDAFGGDIDFAQLIKIYGKPTSETQTRYSPPDCIGTCKEAKVGNPDPKHVSTSYVERQNLTMRMAMRRFTRLTNAFSKKLENHALAVSLYFFHYNFCRVHMSLKKQTPAMAAGIADHAWTLKEMVELLEQEEAAVIGTKANKRGPYKKSEDSD